MRTDGRASTSDYELPLAALFAAVIAVGFFAPSIFFGEVPTFRDFINTFLPHKVYAARRVAGGQLPLWSPESGFGAPFLANYQSGVLYPLSALFYGFPNAVGVGLYLAANLWVAGVGIILWLRKRGVALGPRLFAAVVMMLGGPMISITPWNHLAVAVWIPLALLGAERLVERPTAGRFAALTAVLVVQGLGGSPEAFAQSSVLTAVTTILAAKGSKDGLRGMVLACAAGVLALALCGPQLLPTAEYYRQTERAAGLSREDAMTSSLSPRTLLTLLVPHHVVDGVVEPPIDGRAPFYWSIYLGILPLCLVPLGLGRRSGRRWGLVALVAFVFALGDHTPIYPALYELAPRVFGAFRYPQKFLVTAHVALAVLAAYGLAWLLGRFDARRRSLVAAAVIVLTVVDLVEVHGPAMLFTSWKTLLDSPAPALLSLDERARLFLYQPAGDGIYTWLPKLRYGTDWRKRQQMLWASLAANVSLVYGVRFVNNGDSFATGIPEVKQFQRALREAPVARSIHALRSLNVGLLVGEKPLQSPEIELVREAADDRTWIYRVVEPAPRIYFARRIHAVASVAAAMALLLDPSFAPGSDATVELAAAAETIESRGGEVKIVRDEPERLILEVEGAGRGLLVVGDAIFPGWSAAVDGVATPILRANGLVRAIVLEPGRHVVTFSYAPASFRRGLAVAGVAGALCSMIVLGLAMRGAE